MPIGVRLMWRAAAEALPTATVADHATTAPLAATDVARPRIRWSTIQFARKTATDWVAAMLATATATAWAVPNLTIGFGTNRTNKKPTVAGGLFVSRFYCS